VVSGLEAARWIDHGPDFYAAVTFNDSNRRLLVGWMSNWNYAGDVPTSPWKGAQSIPRELALKTVDGRISLVQEPVRELRAARSGPVTHGKTLDLDLKWKAGDADRFGVDLRTGPGQYTRVAYDTAAGELSVDRTHSGQVAFHPFFPGVDRVKVPLRDGRLRLRIVLDSSSVEVFADDGAASITQQILPGDGDGVALFSDGGTATVLRKDIWKLT
jgi:levanase